MSKSVVPGLLLRGEIVLFFTDMEGIELSVRSASVYVKS